MTADAVVSDATVPPAELPEASAPAGEASGAPLHADELESRSTPLIKTLDADLLLHGLGVLADLIGEASETLDQCLLTIEDKLNALAIAQEQDRWVPIQATRPWVDPEPSRGEGQMVQQRVFGGVPVTILKLGPPEAQCDPPERRERQYELGYSLAGANGALMVRATFEPANKHDGLGRISDLKLLREVPLEIRLKAIREIPTLLTLLDLRGPQVDRSEQSAASERTSPPESTEETTSAGCSDEATSDNETQAGDAETIVVEAEGGVQQAPPETVDPVNGADGPRPEVIPEGAFCPP